MFFDTAMDEKEVNSNCVNENDISEPNSPTLETVSGFSTSSSPLPPEPFEALFSVKFSGNVEKDGDVVKYTIKSKKVGGVFIVKVGFILNTRATK